MGFKIVTDTTADLPEAYIAEHDLGIMSVCYMINGETYSREQDLDWKEFYRLMREEEKMPTTSQINPEVAKEYFTEYLKESNELLYIAFSSGLSGTYNSARIAAEEIMEERPEVKIKVFDSKGASMGEGLLVHKAVMLKEQGKTIEETADWLESHVLNLVHVFTVDDLNHLYRGGRVSKTTAIIGTLAGIKPILHVDDEGHLIPIQKKRGRKKSLTALVDYMEEKAGSFRGENDIVFISHADSLEDAQAVRDEVRERFGIDKFLINHIGPTIGAHSGPGTIALFFLGDKR